MATGERFRRIALALPGTVEAAHFDRRAFRVRRIYATLDPKETSANIAFSPSEQEFKCMTAAELFQPIDNGWGRQGWTTMLLADATDEDIEAALTLAHAHAVGKRRSAI